MEYIVVYSLVVGSGMPHNMNKIMNTQLYEDIDDNKHRIHKISIAVGPYSIHSTLLLLLQIFKKSIQSPT